MAFKSLGEGPSVLDHSIDALDSWSAIGQGTFLTAFQVFL
jgi:hypothetical protein